MVKILVVEDELIVAMELKSRLHELGYSVCGTVVSGEEAIELTARHNPDIILMDINIKGAYDGVRAAEIIKIDHDIPIIFLTAFSDPKTLQRAKITEPYGYIIKPFEEKEVHTAIEIAVYKHNMEKTLRESKRRLSITLKSIGEGIIATDKEGIINYINPAAENLTGYKFDETVGKGIPEILYVNNQYASKNIEAAIKELLQKGFTNKFPETIIITCKNGKEIIIESGVSLIIDDNGNLDGIVLSFRDITDRKKMEEKLKIALDKAEESNRMKSAFLNNMSHEFRTPMSGFLGFAQILKDELPDEHNKKIADMLIESGNRLMTTLNSILQFSQLESDKVETNHTEIHVKDIIKNLVKKFQNTIRGKGLEVKSNLRNKNIIVLADEKLLNRALGLIINNAIKFTKNGAITFEAGKTLQHNKEWAVIGITDTGIGISKDKLNIIFNEFRQVSEGKTRSYEGTGLGLTIAKKIVEMLQGYITVESQIGKGSRFAIHLPLVLSGNGKTNKTFEEVNQIL